MLKRKIKGVVMDSSQSYAYDDDARTRFKHQSLMQDYNELFKETEEKRRNILLAKRRKHVLLAEVRFLRQRYEELMEYKSREQELARLRVVQSHREAIPIERNQRDREVALPNPVPVLDLNQIANDDDEEEIPAQIAMEPARMEKKNPMKFSISKVGKPPLPPRQKDMKLSVCREIKKGPSRIGKRKISMQDHVALQIKR